ncbi:MAG: PAS domain S-box protein [Bacteroidales bacterium]|nr:PAS domain S-box protein [Bacteroidales bacterium]
MKADIIARYIEDYRVKKLNDPWIANRISNIPESQQEKQYSEILNSFKDAVLILNDFFLVDCNEEALKIFGCEKREDFLNTNIFDYTHFLKSQYFITNIKALRKINSAIKGNPQYFEWKLAKANGQIINAEISITPLKFSRDKLLLCVVRDISELKRSRLVQSLIYDISNAANTTKDLPSLTEYIQKRLNQIIDTKNFYVALFDKQHNEIALPYFSDENDSFTTIPTKKSLTSYVLSTGQPLLANEEKIEQMVKAGEIEYFGSKAKIWLGVPLKINEEVVGMLGVQSYTSKNAYTCRDKDVLEFVSNQISHYIERKRHEDAIRIEKAYFEQLFKSSPEAVVLTDIEGKILRINEEFTKLFGYSTDDSIGKNLDNLVVPEEFAAEGKAYTARTHKGERIFSETIRLKKDGSRVNVSILTTPVYTENGQVAVYGIYRDITLQKETESKLREAKENAEEADKLKTTFLKNLSHEIRTPMNAIIGFSNLLTDPDLSVVEKDSFIDHINSSCNNLLSLINDIIDISKIESSQIEIYESSFYINKFLSEMYMLTNDKLSHNKKSNININMSLDSSDDFEIVSDQGKIQRILLFLIDNAIKFTEKGSIEFGYRKVDNDQMLFFVKDTGVGIKPEKQSLIFDSFRKLGSEDKIYRGTGIGLYLSKCLVSTLGGDIWVESTPGKGSTFFFTVACC